MLGDFGSLLFRLWGVFLFGFIVGGGVFGFIRCKSEGDGEESEEGKERSEHEREYGGEAGGGKVGFRFRIAEEVGVWLDAG